MKTAYPEFPFSPPPKPDVMPYENAVKYLTSKYPVGLAKSVFAVLYAEAAKNKERTAFVSPGGHNYAGVQTDNKSRWSAPGIIGQYAKIDSGKVQRAFAIFQSDETFLDFMANRISAKTLDGNDGDDWTNDYIQKWWSPKAKAEYVKGTEKYNQKLAIFNTAISKFTSIHGKQN